MDSSKNQNRHFSTTKTHSNGHNTQHPKKILEEVDRTSFLNTTQKQSTAHTTHNSIGIQTVEEGNEDAYTHSSVHTTTYRIQFTRRTNSKRWTTYNIFAQHLRVRNGKNIYLKKITKRTATTDATLYCRRQFFRFYVEFFIIILRFF